MATQIIITKTIHTPLGDMLAGVLNDELCLLEFDSPSRIKLQQTRLQKLFDAAFNPGEHELFKKVDNQLHQYFNGNRMQFDLPVNINGSEFPMSVWHTLKEIPYGKTVSYGDLAARLGDKNKVRAVGKANGANRIAIIIPCHRVIGADGSLIGYAGELWRKQKLLNLEAQHSGTGVQMELFA